MPLHVAGEHFWVQQGDAVLSQANPVSTTVYSVLATNTRVKIISIDSVITWAVTQPTPLQIFATVDGISWGWSKVNPVSATDYICYIHPSYPENAFPTDTLTAANIRFPLLECTSISIRASITWAVTQPTPLVCRVKWAKWM